MKKSKEHLVANITNNGNKKTSLWAPVKHVIFRRVTSEQTTCYSVHQSRKKNAKASFFLFVFCLLKFSRLARFAFGVLFSLTHATVKSEKACPHTSVYSAGKSLLEQKSLLHDNDVRPVKRRQ